MNLLDMRTVIISSIVSNAISAGVVYYLFRQNRAWFAGIGFWLVGYLLEFFAVFLYALRGLIPDILSYLFSNLFLIGGIGMVLVGLERFVGKRRSQIHNVILLMVFAAVHSYFFFVQPNLAARQIAISLGLWIVCAQCVWLLAHGDYIELRPISMVVRIVFIAFCAVSVARIILDLILPANIDFFQSGVYGTLIILTYQMLFVILTFTLFLLVNSRLFFQLDRDIQQRIQVETQLHQSESLYREMFTGHSAVMLLVDPDSGMIVNANSAAAEFYGYSVDELLQMNVDQLDTQAPEEVARMRREVQSSERSHFIVSNRLASGETRDIEFYSVPVKTSDRQLLFSIIHDITERRQAEELLRASEKRFRSFFELGSVGMAILSPEKTWIELNDRLCEILGYSREELKALTCAELTYPDDREVDQEWMERLQSGESNNYSIDKRFLHKNGSILETNLSVGCTRDPEGNIEQLTVIFLDITRRKQVQRALHDRNQMLAALQQVMFDLVNRHDIDDILNTLLAEVRILLNASHSSIDLIENNDTLVTCAVTPDQPLQNGDRMRRGEGGFLSWEAIDTRRPAVLEDYSTWSRRRDLYEGFPIHAVLIVPIQNGDRVIGAMNFLRNEPDTPFGEMDIYIAQQLAQMVALVLDNAQMYSRLQSELAERKRAEEALVKLAAFEERQRMARDLHDSANQSIHSLVLFSETLTSTLEKNNIERARQIAERMQESARQALKETRLMLYELQPSDPEKRVDLISDLEARLARVERYAGVKAQIIQEGALEDCPNEWHENLFWITIEALNNTLKHAQARAIQIHFRFSRERLELEISDDGKGFDSAKPRPGGFGLGNMRERAALMGGELTIDSWPGEGARIRFSATLKESQWKK